MALITDQDITVPGQIVCKFAQCLIGHNHDWPYAAMLEICHLHCQRLCPHHSRQCIRIQHTAISPMVIKNCCCWQLPLSTMPRQAQPGTRCDRDTTLDASDAHHAWATMPCYDMMICLQNEVQSVVCWSRPQVACSTSLKQVCVQQCEGSMWCLHGGQSLYQSLSVVE